MGGRDVRADFPEPRENWKKQAIVSVDFAGTTYNSRVAAMLANFDILKGFTGNAEVAKLADALA